MSKKIHTIQSSSLFPNNGDEIIGFLLRHPEYFMCAVAYRYPLSNQLIEKYQDLWDWRILQFNSKLSWTENFLIKYEDKFHWNSEKLPGWTGQPMDIPCEWIYNPEIGDGRTLSGNKLLPFSEKFIEKYFDKWDWVDLCRNEGVPWSEHLIERYFDKWDWSFVPQNQRFPWFESIINKYKKNIDWIELSYSLYFPWNDELIKKYKNKWGWDALSQNRGLPWTEDLIEKYQNKWDWKGLSGNEAIPWSEQLIEKYIDKWDWTELSGNIGLPWNEEFFKKYFNKWHWLHISGNRGLPWTRELIDKNNWYFQALSDNRAIPWTVELIEKYEGKWDWTVMSGNDSLPWSIELIEKYKSVWKWGDPLIGYMKNNQSFSTKSLSLNKGIPWSIELIEKYENKWDWYMLAVNHSVWDAVVKPYINDKSIEMVMDRIGVDVPVPKYPVIGGYITNIDECIKCGGTNNLKYSFPIIPTSKNFQVLCDGCIDEANETKEV